MNKSAMRKVSPERPGDSQGCEILVSLVTGLDIAKSFKPRNNVSQMTVKEEQCTSTMQVKCGEPAASLSTEQWPRGLPGLQDIQN